MIPCFKSARQTLTLRCPGVVVAVGCWKEDIPSLHPPLVPSRRRGSGNTLEFAAAKCELSEVSQGDFPWLQFLPHKCSPLGCAAGALLLEQL